MFSYDDTPTGWPYPRFLLDKSVTVDTGPDRLHLLNIDTQQTSVTWHPNGDDAGEIDLAYRYPAAPQNGWGYAYTTQDNGPGYQTTIKRIWTTGTGQNQMLLRDASGTPYMRFYYGTGELPIPVVYGYDPDRSMRGLVRTNVSLEPNKYYRIAIQNTSTQCGRGDASPTVFRYFRTAAPITGKITVLDAAGTPKTPSVPVGEALAIELWNYTGSTRTQTGQATTTTDGTGTFAFPWPVEIPADGTLRVHPNITGHPTWQYLNTIADCKTLRTPSGIDATSDAAYWILGQPIGPRPAVNACSLEIRYQELAPIKVQLTLQNADGTPKTWPSGLTLPVQLWDGACTTNCTPISSLTSAPDGTASVAWPATLPSNPAWSTASTLGIKPIEPKNWHFIGGTADSGCQQRMTVSTTWPSAWLAGRPTAPCLITLTYREPQITVQLALQNADGTPKTWPSGLTLPVQLWDGSCTTNCTPISSMTSTPNGTASIAWPATSPVNPAWSISSRLWHQAHRAGNLALYWWHGRQRLPTADDGRYRLALGLAGRCADRALPDHTDLS